MEPVAGTQNGFSSTPLLEGVMSCERCHGGGKNHVSAMTSGKGASDIVNPAKLDPAQRDSICAQCHLTGTARIARLRATGDVYQPGKLLSDYTAYFIWPGGVSAITRANSHF